MSGPEDENFLGRWSARKLRARSDAAPVPAEARPAEQPTEAAAGKTDAEVLEELGLPDPESLMKGDDFKAFLRAGVPARLRARALRRLWLSDPVLANLDGLNDYEQDFTDKTTVRPDLKTAYRVGKGILRQVSEPAAAAPMDRPETAAALSAEELAAEHSSEAARTGADDARIAVAGAVQHPRSAAPNGTDSATGDPAAGDSAEPERRPPRMHFRFEAG